MQFVTKELLRVRRPSYFMKKLESDFQKCEIQFHTSEIQFHTSENV